jgi:hypothetical protein
VNHFADPDRHHCTCQLREVWPVEVDFVAGYMVAGYMYDYDAAAMT